MRATADISVRVVHRNESRSLAEIDREVAVEGFLHRLNLPDETAGQVRYVRWEGPEDGIVAVDMVMMEYVRRLPWDLWCVGYEQRYANDVTFFFQRRAEVTPEDALKTRELVEYDVRVIDRATLPSEERG